MDETVTQLMSLLTLPQIDILFESCPLVNVLSIRTVIFNTIYHFQALPKLQSITILAFKNRLLAFNNSKDKTGIFTLTLINNQV